MNALIYPNGLDAANIQVKAIAQETLIMQDLGTMFEYRRAVAQMILLVGSQIRRETPRLHWPGLEHIPENLDEAGLLNLTTTEDGDILQRVCRAAWNGHWPLGLSHTSGYTNACRYLEVLATLVCFPVRTPAVSGKAAHGKALWLRVTETLPRAEVLGVNIPELDRLMTILRSCERGDTVIVVAN